jgi:hypothetical protein
MSKQMIQTHVIQNMVSRSDQMTSQPGELDKVSAGISTPYFFTFAVLFNKVSL